MRLTRKEMENFVRSVAYGSSWSLSGPAGNKRDGMCFKLYQIKEDVKSPYRLWKKNTNSSILHSQKKKRKKQVS